VTLRKGFLQHPGVRPGENVNVARLPDGRIEITGDNPRQSAAAQSELAVALPALCELVWVLSRGYRIALPDIAEAIRRLINSANVVVNRPAVEAGLALLAAGGDFTAGAIAYEGRRTIRFV
jgi:predicted nucleic-acid-binding protein